MDERHVTANGLEQQPQLLVFSSRIAGCFQVNLNGNDLAQGDVSSLDHGTVIEIEIFAVDLCSSLQTCTWPIPTMLLCPLYSAWNVTGLVTPCMVKSPVTL